MITHKEIQKIDLVPPFQRITIRLIAENAEDQQAILNGGPAIDEYISYHFNVVKVEDARPPIYILKTEVTS